MMRLIPGQNHVHRGDPHELPAAKQKESILINVNENANNISASNAIQSVVSRLRSLSFPNLVEM